MKRTNTTLTYILQTQNSGFSGFLKIDTYLYTIYLHLKSN